MARLTTWDYHVGQCVVFIEEVSRGSVTKVIAWIPLDKGFDAEVTAEQICNAHNAATKE